MSFSLPYEVLDTLKVVVCVRVTEHGDLRSSFELKALPSRSLALSTSQSQSIMRFEVIEEHHEITVAISKESDTSQIPSAPTQRQTSITSYVGAENSLPQGLNELDHQEGVSSIQSSDDPWDVSLFCLPFASSDFMTSATTDLPMLESSPQAFQDNSSLGSAGSSVVSSQEIETVAFPGNPLGSPVSSPVYDSGHSSLPPISSGRQASSTQKSVKTSPPTITSGRQPRARNFPCTQLTCTRSFTSTYTRDAHMLTHRPKHPKAFQCTIGCGASFSRQHDRWRHEVTQHGKSSRWRCSRCFQFFSSQRRLDTHTDSCHGGRAELADGEEM